MAESLTEGKESVAVDKFGLLVSELLREEGRNAQFINPGVGTLSFGVSALPQNVSPDFLASFDYSATIFRATHSEVQEKRYARDTVTGCLTEATIEYIDDSHGPTAYGLPEIRQVTEDEVCAIITGHVAASPIVKF